MVATLYTWWDQHMAYGLVKSQSCSLQSCHNLNDSWHVIIFFFCWIIIWHDNWFLMGQLMGGSFSSVEVVRYPGLDFSAFIRKSVTQQYCWTWGNYGIFQPWMIQSWCRIYTSECIMVAVHSLITSCCTILLPQSCMPNIYITADTLLPLCHTQSQCHWIISMLIRQMRNE